MANHADKMRINSYVGSIGELIHALGYEAILRASMRHSYFAWLFHFGLYQIARVRVHYWEKNPANREQIERMEAYARRNLALPPGLSPKEEQECVRRASHRYRVYWDALQLSGVTNSKSRLIAMYLDGSQHHIRQEVALHLTTVDKGQITQPWQGIGAFVDNGHGRLEPFVLTGGRQERYATRAVENLSLIPMAGFERILICRPRTPVLDARPEPEPLAKCHQNA
jgi:hypothetical protein